MTGQAADDRLCDASQQDFDELALRTRMERIDRKLLVLSGKGGVGKSTVAVNLAIALARAGRRVGLLDVDLHGPSIPRMLGLSGHRLCPDAAGGVISPVTLDGEAKLSVVSIGMLLDSAADAVIWRGPMKYGVIRQFLKDVEWGRLDYLVIDSPPGTGDEPLAVAQLVGEGAAAVVVTTPQDVAVADVRRSVSFCRSLELPVAGILENMSGLLCPHCGKEVEPFKRGGGEALAAEMGVAFLGRVPMDPRIVAAGDEGTPFLQSLSESPASRALESAVEPILAGDRPALRSQPANTPPEPQPMKIAIPVADGTLCMHFGHCQQFALVEADPADQAVSGVRYLDPPPHEPGVLPRWLGEQGADVIIAGGMGRRAQGLFAEGGIRVVVGAPAGTPEEIASAYLAGTLEAGENVCDH
jgi:Mrp family chromosome partitioning ATPase/predicted Fe-Mo cluster-binding NifX family protein